MFLLNSLIRYKLDSTIDNGYLQTWRDYHSDFYFTRAVDLFAQGLKKTNDVHLLIIDVSAGMFIF